MTGLLLTVLLAAQDFPRSELRPISNPPISIEVTQAKAGYEALARMTGINVMFDPDFRDSSTPAPVRIQNASLLDALGTLSMQTHNFVEVLDSQTVIVAPDNPTRHRRYDTQVMKTFHLTNGGPKQLTQIVTALRMQLNARYIAQSTAANAVIIRETPDRVALAESIVSAIDTPKPGVSATVIASNAMGHILTGDSNGVHTLTPARTALQAVSGRPTSFRMNDSSKTMFESIAKEAGLAVIFDPDFRGDVKMTFNVGNIDPLNALDFLALQTNTFWTVLDAKTIFVAPDSPARRRDFESLTIKTFNLGGPGNNVRMVEIATALRTLLNMRYVAMSPTANTIAIRATPTDVLLAENIIENLKDSAATLSQSSDIPSGSESESLLKRRAVRSFSSVDSEVKDKGSAPITFETNQNVRSSYEELAKIIGLHITFDRRFQDGPGMPMKIEGAGAADALDFLSLQTRNIWEMADANTIIVAPDNQSTLRDVERADSRTMHVTNLTRQGVVELNTALKILLNLRQTEPVANDIQLNDTKENIALAEKVIAEFDRPGRQ